MNVLYGQQSDIDAWMTLVRKVRWNFPGLETEQGLEEYKQTVEKFIGKRQAIGEVFG